MALDASAPLTKGRRRRLDPEPHFKPDQQQQLDAIRGCPDLMVPEEHQARQVWSVVSALDVSKLEERYSSLGRRGYSPRRLLGLWIYASLVGEHHASKLARRCKTDLALQWLCGGHAPSDTTLKRFRRENESFFKEALIQTVALAQARGLLDLEDLAADSLRLRAQASTAEVRTEARSRERLAELKVQGLLATSDDEKQLVLRKRAKHEHALQRCKDEGRTNVVLTNELAGLLKFPHGASLPGHRVTAMASGISCRFVVGVLIDASGHDYGKLKPIVEETKKVLGQVEGLELDKLNVTLDAGYFSAEDLLYAEQNAEWLEAIIAPTPNRVPKNGMLGREHFIIVDGYAPICPAGREMQGPYTRPTGEEQWRGRECSRCELKAQCTRGKTRSIVINPPLERARARFRDPEVRARYRRRIGTIEPVFAHIEDAMGYRRASSRHPNTVRAEILLKFLAHNVARLLSPSRAQLVWLVFRPTL